jgi:hypothetical protein
MMGADDLSPAEVTEMVSRGVVGLFMEHMGY